MPILVFKSTDNMKPYTVICVVEIKGAKASCVF